MDFSSQLFNKTNELPTVLPVRLRLPDGNTRYSYSITLEEIHSCGFKGPYQVPEISEDEIVEWDSVNEVFYKRERTPEEKKSYLVDQETRSKINNLLVKEQEFNNNLSFYTDAYISCMLAYFDSLRNLLANNSPLTLDQIPADPENLYPRTSSQLYADYEKYFEACFEGFKKEYETYGVIFFVDRRFHAIFTPDPSWVKGNADLPPDAATPDFNYR